MDTPKATRLTPNRISHSNVRRRLRVAFFVGLILMAQGTLAFLLTWFDPPRETVYRTIDFSQGHMHFTPGGMARWT